jgi:tetratricopeptide (TPR) repeat protein
MATVSADDKIKKITDVLLGTYTLRNIDNDKDLDIIYNMIVNNIVPDVATDTNRIVLLYLGYYYELKKETSKMLVYYLLAMKQDCQYAMYSLGRYYYDQKDYNNMFKYYLLAMKQDCQYAMYSLGRYYYDQKDYDNMFKYYSMAMEKGNIYVIHGIGHYYQIKKDYANMIKYYLIAIEKNNDTYSMINLAIYYHRQKDLDNTTKYLIMAVENNNKTPVDAMTFLYAHYLKTDIYTGLMVFSKFHKKGIVNADTHLIKLLQCCTDKEILLKYINNVKTISIEADIMRTKINDMETYITELELAPEGPKYKEAKEHFESVYSSYIKI